MLAAEPAIFIHFQSVRVILLVFHCVIVALLAFGASQSDLNSHDCTSDKILNGAAAFEAGKRTYGQNKENNGRCAAVGCFRACSRFISLGRKAQQKSLSCEVMPVYHIQENLSRFFSKLLELFLHLCYIRGSKPCFASLDGFAARACLIGTAQKCPCKHFALRYNDATSHNTFAPFKV